MWWWGLVQAALAGQVFINGAPVDPAELAGTTLEQAEVRFDDEGNVHVVVSDPVLPAAPAEVAAPADVAAPAEVAEVAETESEHDEDSEAEATLASTTPAAGAWPEASRDSITTARTRSRRLHPSGVPEARWWLVVEDDGSRGHTIEILINDTHVETIRSGEIPRILDVGGHLVPGPNRVVLRSVSTQASGGPLYVYVGHGSDRDGTVMLEQPEVQFALGASRSGTYQREYTVNVD